MHWISARTQSSIFLPFMGYKVVRAHQKMPFRLKPLYKKSINIYYIKPNKVKLRNIVQYKIILSTWLWMDILKIFEEIKLRINSLYYPDTACSLINHIFTKTKPTKSNQPISNYLLKIFELKYMQNIRKKRHFSSPKGCQLFSSNLQGLWSHNRSGTYNIMFNVTTYINNSKLNNQFLKLCKASSIGKNSYQLSWTEKFMLSDPNWKKSITKTNFTAAP